MRSVLSRAIHSEGRGAKGGASAVISPILAAPGHIHVLTHRVSVTLSAAGCCGGALSQLRGFVVFANRDHFSVCFMLPGVLCSKRDMDALTYTLKCSPRPSSG